MVAINWLPELYKASHNTKQPLYQLELILIVVSYIQLLMVSATSLIVLKKRYHIYHT